jgi:hypothetical protein
MFSQEHKSYNDSIIAMITLNRTSCHNIVTKNYDVFPEGPDPTIDFYIA